MNTHLFLALARRHDRILTERHAAWCAGNDFLADKLLFRAFALQRAILTLEGP